MEASQTIDHIVYFNKLSVIRQYSQYNDEIIAIQIVSTEKTRVAAELVVVVGCGLGGLVVGFVVGGVGGLVEGVVEPMDGENG